MEYEIPEYNIPTMEKKLGTIQRQCNKLGCPFSYAIGTPYYKKINAHNRDFNLKFFPVDVQGNAVINGWEFIATLEHFQSGNVIKRCNTNVIIPEKFYTSGNYCDHCNTVRNRDCLYLIRNVSSGEFKQVGKSCLKLYTGGLSAAHVAAYMSIVTLLDDLEDGQMKFLSTRGNSGYHYYEISDIIACALAVTEQSMLST